MPQMAPYNWLMMYFIFNFIVTFILSTNFYLYLYKFKLSNKKNKKFSWLW